MSLVDLGKEEMEIVSDKMTRIRVKGHQAFMIRVSAKKGAAIPPHTHGVEQLTVVLSGTMRMLVAGKPIPLRNGTVLVTPAGATHEGEVLEDVEYLDFWPESVELFGTANRPEMP